MFHWGAVKQSSVSGGWSQKKLEEFETLVDFHLQIRAEPASLPQIAAQANQL